MYTTYKHTFRRTGKQRESSFGENNRFERKKEPYACYDTQ